MSWQNLTPEERAERIMDRLVQTIELSEDGATVTTTRDTVRIIAEAIREAVEAAKR